MVVLQANYNSIVLLIGMNSSTVCVICLVTSAMRDGGLQA
jgi:hypothetical protein